MSRPDAAASEPGQFSRTLRQCRDLYISSGQLCALEYPQLIRQSGAEFIQLMDDLHRALVLKVYFSICEADRKWSRAERQLAQELFDHLWDRWLEGAQLTETARRAAQDSARLKWYSLVRPFDRLAPLRERVGELETIVIRLANLVARADGRLAPSEADAIRSLQEELHRHLRRLPIEGPDQHEMADAQGPQAIQQIQREAEHIQSATRTAAEPEGASRSPTGRSQIRTQVEFATPPKQPAKVEQLSLEDALAELKALIGLKRVKHEVRTLTNFLELQQRRRAAGLPETDVSLHMVFQGNPGTGKTSVARIVGKIFGAMGILAKGHLVETDRSGLVAEYAGQTGPKTNAKIDEALDGILFIDEAYSLVAAGEDPFGGEAVQALLKRAEDDRQRLVVILAGYPDEMTHLLMSNPGLSSRFGRRLTFDDFAPLELARIYGLLCSKNQYQLAPPARIKLLEGFSWWYDHRDGHFGNGRAVRNLFEQAIRRLANRLADIEKLSADQLSLLEANDVEFANVPAGVFVTGGDSARGVQIACPNCQYTKDVSGKFLGQRVKCPKCSQHFVAEWGELLPSATE